MRRPPDLRQAGSAGPRPGIFPAFTSLEEMLQPEALSRLAGQSVSRVDCFPHEVALARSGSRFMIVETDEGRGPRFVLKRLSAQWDWLMRATDDRHCRAVTLWQHGLLDRLAPHIDHGIIACARDDGSWALLMRDLGPTLLAYVRFTAWENDAFLEAMAHLHATFWSAPELEDQGLGLCPMRAAYTMFAPSSGRRESASNLEIPQRIVEGWDLLPSLIAPDVAEILAALLEDPTPLCQALRRLPQTLNHGDWRHANQGLWRDDRRRVVLLDWQLATIAPPGLDLGRYLGTNSVLLPGSKEATIERYRHFLAGRLGSAFDDDWWRPQLALALLGGFLQDGWAIALKATSWHVGADARDHWRQDLLWWSQQVRAGAAFLRF